MQRPEGQPRRSGHKPQPQLHRPIPASRRPFQHRRVPAAERPGSPEQCAGIHCGFYVWRTSGGVFERCAWADHFCSSSSKRSWFVQWRCVVQRLIELSGRLLLGDLLLISNKDRPNGVIGFRIPCIREWEHGLGQCVHGVRFGRETILYDRLTFDELGFDYSADGTLF